MATRERNREGDMELLIPASGLSVNGGASKSSSPSDSPLPPISHHSGREAFSKVIRSWASKKFMTGCVILLPMAITFYITWGFIHFVDGFFSPIYSHLGINVFGLGFVTSISFIFLVGIFMSSWLGASVLALGEWIIKKMPLVSYIYAASKQISGAISPDQSSNAFKEVAIIRHPRIGEYAFGFITSSTVTLRQSIGEEELCCVYVPSNHLYIGDIFLISSKDILRPNLSVREGIEIVISGGLSVPQILTTLDVQASPSGRVAVRKQCSAKNLRRQEIFLDLTEWIQHDDDQVETECDKKKIMPARRMGVYVHVLKIRDALGWKDLYWPTSLF